MTAYGTHLGRSFPEMLMSAFQTNPHDGLLFVENRAVKNVFEQRPVSLLVLLFNGSNAPEKLGYIGKASSSASAANDAYISTHS